MNKTLLFRIVIVILLCGLCFFSAGVAYLLLVRFLNDQWQIRVGRSFSSEEVIEYLLYMLSLTVLPLFFLGLWRFTPVYSIKGKVVSVLVFFGCLSLLVGLRIAFIARTAHLRRLQFVQDNSSYRFPSPTVYAGELNLWVYVMLSLLIAAGGIRLWLKEQKNEVVTFSFEEKD